MKWHGMIGEDLAESLNDIAKTENLSRARIIQIMKLMKLPVNVKRFLASLQDPMEIQRYPREGCEKV
jgi:hypothetical protein